MAVTQLRVSLRSTQMARDIHLVNRKIVGPVQVVDSEKIIFVIGYNKTIISDRHRCGGVAHASECQDSWHRPVDALGGDRGRLSGLAGLVDGGSRRMPGTGVAQDRPRRHPSSAQRNLDRKR